MRIRDPGWRQFGSGIRDGKKSDPGSGINIPDPTHCWGSDIPSPMIEILTLWSSHKLLKNLGALSEYAKCIQSSAKKYIKFKSLLSILDTLEWKIKTSHATVPLSPGLLVTLVYAVWAVSKLRLLPPWGASHRFGLITSCFLGCCWMIASSSISS